jgi:D-lactate dehydrogenase
VERNSYHTVSSLTLVLASGTVIDTAAPDAEAALAKAEPELAQGMMQLRAELLADEQRARPPATRTNRSCSYWKN